MRAAIWTLGFLVVVGAFACATYPRLPECSDLELSAIEWKIREEWGVEGVRDAEEARSERASLAETMSCKLAKEDE